MYPLLSSVDFFYFDFFLFREVTSKCGCPRKTIDELAFPEQPLDNACDQSPFNPNWKEKEKLMIYYFDTVTSLNRKKIKIKKSTLLSKLNGNKQDLLFIYKLQAWNIWITYNSSLILASISWLKMPSWDILVLKYVSHCFIWAL